MSQKALFVAFTAVAIGAFALWTQAATAPPDPVGAGGEHSAGTPGATAPPGRATIARSMPLLTRHADLAAPAVPEAPAADAAQPLTTSAMADHLATAFAAEPTEDARIRAQSLETRVRAVLPRGSSVRTIECRTTMCRIETGHASLDEYQDFVQHAFHDSALPNGPSFVMLLEQPAPGSTGPVTAVAYLGNEGSTLPVGGPNAEQ